MKPLLAAAISLMAASVAAQDWTPDPGDRSPEQHAGQVSQIRLETLDPGVPRFLDVPLGAPSVDPTQRLLDFLDASGVALWYYSYKTFLGAPRGLSVYLREGLKDPLATQGGNAAVWREVWAPNVGTLDREIARFRALLKEGEAIRAGVIPAQTKFPPSKGGYVPLEDKPEFDTPAGRRFHEANVLAASVLNMRELLIRKSRAAAAGSRALAAAHDVLPR